MTQNIHSADGLEVCLIWSHVNRAYCARVYSEDKSTFKDYMLIHYDLNVLIKDPDAFFYDDTMVLDHSPATLGKTR